MSQVEGANTNAKPEIKITRVENGYPVQRYTLPGGTLVGKNLDEAMSLARMEFEEPKETEQQEGK